MLQDYLCGSSRWGNRAKLTLDHMSTFHTSLLYAMPVLICCITRYFGTGFVMGRSTCDHVKSYRQCPPPPRDEVKYFTTSLQGVP